MSRVLVVYKEFPAPSVGHAGGRAVARLIESLHRRGHTVFLVARLRDEETPLLDEMSPLCERIVTVPHHNSRPGPGPLAWLSSYIALRRAAARALREFRPDMLHLEVTRTAIALLGLRRPFTSFRPLDVNWFLLRQRAAQVRGPRRWVELAASLVMRYFEPWVCRRYDLIAAISEGDRRLLTPRCRPRPVVILPLAPAVAADALPAVEPGANVLFVGAMYRTFNIQAVTWFMERVWPLVLEQEPQARFYIVGYDPPEQVQAYHDGQHVFVTGSVDDLTAWYRAATVFVSPMLVAGGLLQKVVDALAMGVPVVATGVSNHGVGATPDEHLLVADEADRFAAAVVRLLRDPTAWQRLAQAGPEFVRANYNLEEAITRWEKVWSAQV